MFREFTKAVGRYQKGDIRDYPIGTWNSMAAQMGVKLDSFSVEVSGDLAHPHLIKRNTAPAEGKKIPQRG